MPYVEAQQPETASSPVDRTGDVPRVTCPHCQFRNEFPGFDMVFAFLCHQCGKPVRGDESVQ